MLFGGSKSKKVVEYDKVEGEILRIGSSLCSGGYSDNETNFHFILAGSPDIYYIQKVDVELGMKFSLTKEGDRISFMTESGAMSYKRIVERESIEFISLNELLKLQSN